MEEQKSNPKGLLFFNDGYILFFYQLTNRIDGFSLCLMYKDMKRSGSV